MAYQPRGHRQQVSIPKTYLKLVTCGVVLGLLQIAASLGLDGAEIACVRLALSVGTLGIVYALWRALPGLWSTLVGGFLTGLGYFGTSVYWLGSSANPNPDTFILGEIALGAGAMWLFVPWWAVWFGMANLLSRFSGRAELAPVAFVAAFSASNLMLADLVMGIPLSPLSLIAIDTPAAVFLKVTGQYGLDSLIVLTGTFIGLLLCAGWIRLAGAVVALCAAASLTSLHYPRLPAQTVDVPTGQTVYLAQPSLPHVSLMDPERVVGIVHDEMLRQVRAGVDAGADLIVLPEGALLVDLTSPDDILANELAALLPDAVYVIAGFGRVDVNQTDLGFTVRPFNSVALIDRSGIRQIQDKAHLVPFGETMPDIFFKMGFDVVAGPAGGMGSGDRLGVFRGVGELPPFALVICYEAILSGAVSRESDGAGWLLNVSAETLFRGTIGPRLLHDHIRIRAIETGLPILRSTAHAFSGGIDANGVSFGLLSPETQSGVTVTIPAAQMTYFRKVGYRDYYVALSLLLALLAGSRLIARRT